jgi:membrane protein involved in colicin uptake
MRGRETASFYIAKVVIVVDPMSIGKGVESAGGGIIGAIALLMVGLGLGIAYCLWKAYQDKVKEDKTEDQKRIERLEREVEVLREDSRKREDKLIQLVEEGQKIQTKQNEILVEINARQSVIQTEISAIKSQIIKVKARESP